MLVYDHPTRLRRKKKADTMKNLALALAAITFALVATSTVLAKTSKLEFFNPEISRAL